VRGERGVCECKRATTCLRTPITSSKISSVAGLTLDVGAPLRVFVALCLWQVVVEATRWAPCPSHNFLVSFISSGDTGEQEGRGGAVGKVAAR
jgi:hypothetical protein